MSDIWNPRPSRLQRLAQSVKSGTAHDIQGRLASAAPIPPATLPTETADTGSALFVGPEDPGIDGAYDFWFDIDEPVI